MTETHPTLEIRDLHVSIEDKEILKGVNLIVNEGEVHALMGPNGAGKSTLGNAIMGHPRYRITQGDILYHGESILAWSPDQRARAGLFLSFQYPTAIPGVTVVNFLRQAANAMRGGELPIREFRTILQDNMKLLKVPDEMVRRNLNEGFSGGEKKKVEILQLGVLQPRVAILDETDSGLDVDALRTVAEGVNALCGPALGILIITHYNRILNYIRPDTVHVLIDGQVVRSGGADLAHEIEERGYDWLMAGATA